MSNLGLQAIYSLLNDREDTLCERAFWDQENREKGSVPLSVESQRPLNDFAVLAFSLNYEIDYFNIVPILKASGLPLLDRDKHPHHREDYITLILGSDPLFDCLCIK
jgi:hypothetical protein